MVKGEGKKISMTEGDYGISLQITITGVNFEKDDILTFIIKNRKSEEEYVKKDFVIATNNTFDFILTEEESKKITPGVYAYVLDWSREDNFLCNIINDGEFEVENK